jgi:FtsH-binding integral membrane protein
MANSSIYDRFFGGSKIGYKGGSSKTSGLQSLLTLMNERKVFFILIFVNLFIQLGITYYTMENSTISKKITTFWLLAISTMIILLILILVPMPPVVKVILFAAFSYIWGLLLSSIKTKYNESQIRIAMEGALSVFIAMMAAGLGLLVGGIKLGYQFGLFLFVSLLVLLMMRLVSIFSGSLTQMQLGMSIFGVILFSLYIMYDTNVIFRRDYSGDFITASMDYYLDILNLFLNLLRSENS